MPHDKVRETLATRLMKPVRLVNWGACAVVLAAACAPARVGAPGAAPRTVPASVPAASPERPAPRDIEETAWSPIQDDFPFQASVMTADFPRRAKTNTTNKSISIRLRGKAAFAFDTDLLRASAGWTGGFLTSTGVTFDTSHGGHPHAKGDVRFGTVPGPGWADAKGSFADRRAIPYGPLPESWGRWDGLHVIGDDIVLSYTVHGSKVLEQPSVVRQGDDATFIRTFDIDGIKRPLRLLVCDTETATGAATLPAANGVLAVAIPGDERSTSVAVSPPPAGATLETLADGRVILNLPAHRGRQSFKLAVAARAGRHIAVPVAGLDGAPVLADLRKGGTRHWPTPIITKGQPGTTPGPYVVDRLTTPYSGVYEGAPKDGNWRDNIFKRRIMIGGFDFFADGTRAALSTWEGDVWIVSGIDAGLERLQWHRFASGLFEPLGLKIVNDVIHVTGRDQLTRLFDTNGDGEADRYENVNNQATNSPGFHEFTFDLQTDAQGNFYTAKAGPVKGGGRGFGGGGGNGEVTPFAGAIHKISKDGKRRTIYATGFRAPNGLGVSPTGQVTAGDNEGTWMPTSPIHWVRQGGFYGVVPLSGRKVAPEPDPPLAYLSKSYDNSGGSQVWVPPGNLWGPLGGELLHLSYGRASIYLVLKEKVGKLMQGGVVRLVGGAEAVQLTGKPVKLTSSAMRARFNPKDGQLYVAGLSGWQSDAVSLTGFDRVRYTGGDVVSVRGLAVDGTGVKLTFSHALDPASVNERSFSGERWNYQRSEDYGSPEFSVANPGRRGHDPLDVLSAELSKDGKTVTIEIDDLRPVHQMLLKFNLRTTAGAVVKQSVMHTIHTVPGGGRRRGSAQVARAKSGLLLRLAGSDPAPFADATVVPDVALFVAKGRAVSPFVAPGPFRAVWEGTLSPELTGSYVLRAEVRGRLRAEVGGVVLLDKTDENYAVVESKPADIEQKANPLRITLHSAADGGGQLRLSWARVAAAGSLPVWEPVAGSPLRHQPDGAGQEELRAAAGRRAGRALFLDSRCARCHVPSARIDLASTPELTMAGPVLDGIGSRRKWNHLRRWIENPQRVRPTARMPRMLHGAASEEEAKALASYLFSLKDPAFDKVREENAAAVTSRVASLPQSKSLSDNPLFGRLHCNACHNDMQMAASDGRIDLGGVGGKFQRGALAAFLRAPDKQYAWIRMPDYHLSGEEAVELEAVLMGRGGPPERDVPNDPTLVTRGRVLFGEKLCRSCHVLKTDAPVTPTVTLVDLLAAPGTRKPAATNCVEGTGPARFEFSDGERESVRAFLASGLAPALRHSPTEFIERQLTALQCGNCHGQVESFPPLENMGEKLRPEWTAAFIGGRIAYKPRGLKHPDGHEWLPARMPSFTVRAPFLAEGLAARAGLPMRSAPPAPVDAALAKIGDKLLSSDGGFSCIACHAAGARPATQVFEVEGINLAYSAQRLRPEFFRRWLRNPMKVDPQSKMPSYFDDTGASPLDTVLEGRADQQIDAIWHAMRALPLPPR